MHLGQQLLGSLDSVLVLVKIRARDAQLQRLIRLLLVHPFTVATPPTPEARLTLRNLLPNRTCNILNNPPGSLKLLVVLDAHLKPTGVFAGLPGHPADPPLPRAVRSPGNKGVGVGVAVLQEAQRGGVQAQEGVGLRHQVLLQQHAQVRCRRRRHLGPGRAQVGQLQSTIHALQHLAVQVGHGRCRGIPAIIHNDGGGPILKHLH
mmetsp:Transcript_12952/g.31191  ORF Transcript_12952/g.31191 Transcript_12952/m.31191 type:complete len:205 (+) Transcript_12952:521-1135(+)